MLKHHLRIAWRNIRTHRLYAAINVLGLSIGLCACIVIYLIARYDLGFDKFHPDADRIYRIVGDVRYKDGFNMFLNSPFPQAGGLEHAIPGFEKKVGFHTFGSTVTIPAANGKATADFNAQQDDSYASSVILTSPAFFDIFPHPWLVGNPQVLNEPGKVVLSESAMRKYFGPIPADDAIGRTVIYDDSLLVTVAGIVKDWTGLSDLGYTSFISIVTAPNSWLSSRFPTADWNSLLPHTSQAFVKLAPGVTPAQVNAAMAEYVRRTNPQIAPGSTDLHFYLQPLPDMHYKTTLHRVDTGDDFRQAYLPLLYALMGVAGFVLLLAFINFINLSTAQSLQRMREVGVRKIMGSSRKELIAQFLTETFVLAAIAVLVAALLVRPALWLFNGYIPAGVHFHFDSGTFLFLLGMVLLTTLAAGGYPAWVLSSYLPVLSLKGSLDGMGSRRARGRKALIVFQFAVSLLFIIGSLVISRQMHFMRNADKGFDSDAILTLNTWRAKPEQLRLLAQNIRQLAGVREVIAQNNPPMGSAHAGFNLVYKGKQLKPFPVMAQHADTGFIRFYGIKLLAGRNYLPGDSARELVINETYSKALGFDQPAGAVGKLLYRRDTIPYTITGVVADFHQESFHETIKPMAIWNFVVSERSLGIKLSTQGRQAGEAKAAIAGIEKEWKQVFPKTPFSYSFLNESITRLYEGETHTAFLMQAAMVITVFISCLGLFGLALFTARRRQKEIGIRKVLGATVTQVVMLLSRDFLLPVLLALLIASPFAWYLADSWLRDFAYRTSMDVWILVEAGVAAIGLALLTVGFQAMRAARTNPVETLRNE